MPNAINAFRQDSAYPTSTSEYNEVGNFIWNSAPSAGSPLGWVCTVAGRPGTFIPVSKPMSGGIATLTAAAVLTIGKGLQLISLSAGATMTLAAAASHAAEFEMTIKNLANNSVTIATVAGATYADAAAITLAQNAKAVIVGDGSTWYLKA